MSERRRGTLFIDNVEDSCRGIETRDTDPADLDEALESAWQMIDEVDGYAGDFQPFVDRLRKALEPKQ